MDRIEAKLDWVIEALAGDESDDDEPECVEVRLMDGTVIRRPVPSGDGFL